MKKIVRKSIIVLIYILCELEVFQMWYKLATENGLGGWTFFLYHY